MSTWHDILQNCCTASCEGRIDGKCPFRNKKQRKGECVIIQDYIEEHDLYMQLEAEDCEIDYDSNPQEWLDAMFG